MAAINSVLVRDTVSHLVKRRKNWAHRNPGVILVFCIVFIVALGLITLFVHKKLKARKERQLSKPQ
ncbi:hypothetical protein BROUX41_006152 [Berkeleyomyces rouxiae]|uniref:uncharacterized protein n=1 Tax=Berkeleyomyces rouxiae TaxID=2035830 RepID=UPI003B7E1975